MHACNVIVFSQLAAMSHSPRIRKANIIIKLSTIFNKKKLIT